MTEVEEVQPTTLKRGFDIDEDDLKTDSPNPPQKPSKKIKLESLLSKNSLQQLNEIQPGTTFDVRNCGGPPHNPVFEATVLFGGNLYYGRGKSKQLAKQAAADELIRVYHAQRLYEESLENANSDAVPPSQESAASQESENTSVSESDAEKGTEAEAKPLPKVDAACLAQIESGSKTPVQILNETHPGALYSVCTENPSDIMKRFVMSVTIDGITYTGFGANKKLAKQAAARSALINLFEGVESVPNGEENTTSAVPRRIQLQSFADRIGCAVLDKFSTVIMDRPDKAPWKVLAGIVMTRDETCQDLEVICVTTGTKCLSGDHLSLNGTAISDCHGEVLSRRCFMDFMYRQLLDWKNGKTENSILELAESGLLKVKDNFKFHLYISTSPCGDGRIFSPHEVESKSQELDKSKQSKRGLLRTKIEGGEGTIPVTSSFVCQTFDGIMNGDQRLLTHSCSDKVCRWNVLGLQGCLLSQFISPVYLESIVLGSLFHSIHMVRAVGGRLDGFLHDLPEGFKLNRPNLSKMSSVVSRQIQKSPQHAINWILGDHHAEILNATTGKREDGAPSRLCKRDLFRKYTYLVNKIPSNIRITEQPAVYERAKQLSLDYQKCKSQMIKAFKEGNLGTWVGKPVEVDQFEVASSVSLIRPS